MDLGISGRRAIVCGGSAGLGRGVAEALAAEGVDVLIAARSEARLRRTADEINQLGGGRTEWIVADVATEDGRAAILEACPAPDILVNNAGGPPLGDFRNWTRSDWIKALDTNMLSAIFLIQEVIDGMIARRFGRIVNITSGMVKQPVAVLGLSNGARAGLTGFVGGLSRETVRHNVTINNLLPGQFETDRLRAAHARAAEAGGRTPEQQRDAAVRLIPARRFGDPAEFGAACAFLCSNRAGFVTGQNLLLDGGQYPGVL